MRYTYLLFIFGIRYSYAVFVICKQQFVIPKRYSVFVIYMRYSRFFIEYRMSKVITNIELVPITCSIRYGKSNSIFVKSMALTRY